MKKALWLGIGFVLGVTAIETVAFVSFYFRFHLPVRVFPPTAVIAPKSISLEAGKMIRVKTIRGSVALISFTSYGKFNAESTYRWRFRSRTGVETKGTATVKEIAGKGTPVVAGGMKGGIKLGWSQGSQTNCWLYYFEQDMAVQLLPDATFDTEDLGAIADSHDAEPVTPPSKEFSSDGTMKTIATVDEFRKMLTQERCLVFVDAAWSAHSVYARRIIRKFIEDWKRENPVSAVSFYRLDMTEQGTALWKAAGNWVRHESSPVPMLGAGTGAVIWVSNGAIKYYIESAVAAKTGELSDHTRKAFEKPAAPTRGTK